MDTFKSASSRGRRSWLWLAVMLFAVFLGIQLIDGSLTSIAVGDSPAYLLLAKSLATGHGFADISIPGAPPHTQYPPGFPVILAPVLYLLGFNLVWMRLVVVVLGLGAIYMVKLFFEREGERDGKLGVVLALMVATNFYHLFFMKEFMSEIPYAFLSLLALYFFRRYRDDPAAKLYPVVLVVAAAYLTRMIGITLYAAVAMALFLNLRAGGAGGVEGRARVRGLVFFVVAGIVPFGLWTLRSSLLAGDVATYQSIFLQADYYSVDSGLLALSSLAARFIRNIGYYADAVPLSLITARAFKDLAPPIVLKAFSLITLATVLLGFLYELRSRRGVSEFYVLFYFALLTVWPVHGSGDARRYVVPMLPFVYYYLFVGAGVLAGLKGSFTASRPLVSEGSAGGRGFRRAMLIPCILFLALNFLEIREFVRPLQAGGRVYATARTFLAGPFRTSWELSPEALGVESYSKTLPCHGQYLKAALYLKETMAPGELVMARKHEIVALVTGGYALRYPFTGDHDKMERFMLESGVDYVLLDACYVERKIYLAPFIDARRGSFSLLQDDSRGTLVLRYKGG